MRLNKKGRIGAVVLACGIAALLSWSLRDGKRRDLRTAAPALAKHAWSTSVREPVARPATHEQPEVDVDPTLPPHLRDHFFVTLGWEDGLPSEFLFKADAQDNRGHTVKEYLWDFGDGTEMTTSEGFVKHSYAKVINQPTEEQEFRFPVSLRVRDVNGDESPEVNIEVTIHSDIGYLAAHGIHAVEVVPTAMFWEDEPRQWSCRLTARNPGDTRIVLTSIQVMFAPTRPEAETAPLTLPVPQFDPEGGVDIFLKIPEAKVPEGADVATFRAQGRSEDGKPFFFVWTATIHTEEKEAMQHTAQW